MQGHLASISSADQVDQVMSKLLEDAKTASATHNIIGYRVLDAASGKIVQARCTCISACICFATRHELLNTHL